MWYRSPSFILDNQEQEKFLLRQQLDQQNDDVLNPPPPPSMSEISIQNPNPNISAYYQTRAAHHAVVTSDWLAQAQAAVSGGVTGEDTVEKVEEDDRVVEKGESVIEEFNSWRKQPDLAEAVAAIRALASVIRSSKATTMMELEIELKKASDSLKVFFD